MVFLVGVPGRYIRFPLILAAKFYYVINKLIILVSDPHKFDTGLPFKVPLNRYLSIFNH
jgi:hypothetical protein